MAKYIADTKYICSIWPGKVEPQRRNYGPTRESSGKRAVRSTLYELEPVKRNQKPPYFVLEVCDCFEDVIDVVGTSATTERGQRPRLPKPVPVENIVSDLLNAWTGGIFLEGMPNEAKPGIGEIVNSAPSQKELEALKAQQTLYMEYLFQAGEMYHKQNQWKNITENMRLAAEWLGHSREWSSRAIAKNSGPCPLCTQIIPDTAIFCPACHQQVGFLENGSVVRYSAPEILARQIQAPVPPAA